MNKRTVTTISALVAPAAALAVLTACAPPEQQRQYSSAYRPMTFHELSDRKERELRQNGPPETLAAFLKCRERAEWTYSMSRPGTFGANIAASDVMANCMLSESRRQAGGY